MSNKPVKLTLPGLSRIYPRTRLFNTLDQLNHFPVVWIAAPGGAGKTTLVASYLQEKNITPLWYQIDQGDADIASFFYYLGEGLKHLNRSRKRVLPLLTPESQFGQAVFSRNFFRQLFEKMKKPAVLVLDNFELVNNDATFNEILQQGLEEVPPDCQVIITGRALPPIQYSGMSTKAQLAQVGWEELQLTESESTGVINLLNDEVTQPDNILSLQHRAAQGWVSGLVLFNQFYKSDDQPDIESLLTEDADEDLLHQPFFDYFAGEVFNRLPDETQIFLLKTAWLTDIKASTAKQLTDIEGTKKILASLNQRQMFTTRRGLFKPVYTYHPLFKSFLQAQAQEFFSEDELLALKNQAAQILLKEQDIEEAANLFRQIENWSALALIIEHHAQTLSKQGRFRLLQGWLDQLPRNYKEQNAWIMYWCGSTELMFEPLIAKGYFEKAYALFKESDDARGSYLSWLGIMDSIFFAHDSYQDVPRWIDELDLIRKKHSHYPGIEIKGRITFTAFFLQLKGCPQSDSFESWLHKAERLQRFIPDTSTRCLTGAQLAMYYTFYTQTAKLKVVANSLVKIADAGKGAPLARILAYQVEINRRWLTGETDESESVIQKALQVSNDSGVYIAHLRLLSTIVMHYLTIQDIAKAERYLDEFQKYIQHNHRADLINYHYLAGWLAYQKKDFELAHEHTEVALNNTPELHMPFFELLIRCVHCFMLIEIERFGDAREHIAQTKKLAVEVRNESMGTYYLGILEAWLACKQQQPENAIPHLRDAFAYGKKMELVSVPWHVPAMLAPLCAIALANDIEENYVRSFIRKNSLAIPDGAFLLSNWPVPVRIYTLGRFSLLVNDKAAIEGNGSHNKPRELLCTLIAFGGREVNDSKLEEALWPNADGDAAHRALITNLQRLRNLLGTAKAIQYSDGKLTLDRHYCWVDVWAFERGLSSDDPKQLSHALALYHGNFLESEGDHSWLLASRAHLRHRYLQQLDILGKTLANNHQWREVIDCYNRGLKVDSLYETYYQQLLHAHQQLGQTSEVIRVYRQCQQKLQSELGVPPSRQTTALFESLSQ